MVDVARDPATTIPEMTHQTTSHPTLTLLEHQVRQTLRVINPVGLDGVLDIVLCAYADDRGADWDFQHPVTGSGALLSNAATMILVPKITVISSLNKYRPAYQSPMTNTSLPTDQTSPQKTLLSPHFKLP